MGQLIAECFGLARDLIGLASDGTGRATAAFYDSLGGRFRRAVFFLASVALGALALYYAARVLGIEWLSQLSMLAFACVLTSVWFLATLGFCVTAEVSKLFAPTRRLFEITAVVSLGFLLMVLSLSLRPLSPGLVLYTVLGASILSIFIVRFGIGPRPERAYVIFVVLIGVALLRTSLTSLFPTAASEIGNVISSLDEALVWRARTFTPLPERIACESLADAHRLRFFDKYERALIFYARTDDGGFELFNAAGSHPVRGRPLQPVTSATVDELMAWLTRKEQALVAAVQPPAPERVAVTSIVGLEFFDRVSGQPRIWYSERPGGEVELFSGPGVDPVHQVALQPVTPEIVEKLLVREHRAQRDEELERTQKHSSEVETQRAAAMKRQQVALDAVRSRYVNFAGSGRLLVAVLVVKSGEGDPRATGAIAEAVGGSSSLFRSAFVADGKFAEAHEGSTEALVNMKLADIVDSIILVTSSSRAQAVREAGYELTKSTVTLDARLVFARNHYESQILTSTGTAVAFVEGEAQAKAERNAIADLIEEVRRKLPKEATARVAN